ncbi:MAG: Amino acid transporter protein solute-binding component [Nocardioidaceae bacterium]|nr:Amino acid transporter protein solute-binding component [Nocardioidaceae bacterium]
MADTTSRRSLLRGIGVGALSLPFAAALDACGSTTPGTGASKGSSKGNGRKLKVAIGNEPPYTKLEKDGTVSGCEPDVLQAVLSTMGYGTIIGVVVDYDSMIAGLNAKRWDVIAAGLFMKESRCAAVQYTSPVIVSTESYAVLPGNPKKILTVADAKDNPSLKIAAITGAFEEGILTTGGIPKGQIVSVKDGVSGVEALKAGRCDAFLLPTLSLNEIKKGQSGFDVTAVISDAPKTGSGAAFRKSDTALVKAYDTALDAFKKTSKFADIEKKWGFDAEAANSATVAELCKNPG